MDAIKSVYWDGVRVQQWIEKRLKKQTFHAIMLLMLSERDRLKQQTLVHTEKHSSSRF